MLWVGALWQFTNILAWIAKRSGNISAMRNPCNCDRTGDEQASSIPTTSISFCVGSKAAATDSSYSMKSEPKAIQEAILWFEPWSHVYARICLSKHQLK